MRIISREVVGSEITFSWLLALNENPDLSIVPITFKRPC